MALSLGMRLYVLRHGKAEREAATGLDEDRPLADRGREQIRWLARLFTVGSLRPLPEHVLSSAAARADATARILGEALLLSVRHEEALGLDAAFGDLLELVEGLSSGEQPVLIVGHNPLLSRLVEHLAGGDGLSTGELSVIDLEPRMEGREVGRYRESE